MSSVLQLIVKGRNLNELRAALKDAMLDLGGEHITTGITKNLSLVDEGDDGEMETVQSPFTAQTTATVTHASNVELDSEGLPWDERIHASSKQKNSDGTWRGRRGVDKDFVAQIKSQLRSATKAAPVVQQAPAQTTPGSVNYAPPVQLAPVQQLPPNVPPVQQQTYQAPVQQQVVHQAPPVQQPPVQLTSGHTLQSFTDNFALVISSLVSKGTINQEYVATLCGHFGVQQIWQANPQQIAELFESFANWGYIQKVG